MKRVRQLSFLSDLFSFKTINDEKGNEYVVFENSISNDVQNIQDKTSFEAFENHRHLLDNIKKKEYYQLFPIAEGIGRSLSFALKQVYPNKHFVVYVTLQVHDSMIIRFHQKWINEQWYYDPTSFENPDEKVFIFEA